MTDLPEYPLVTLALFAYNQERYIREAVEAALTQDYSPLEIILSDDCSTDTTFEIMSELANAYVGPHKVLVRRSTVNAGLISHINEVARFASADIVVMAAGDDISLPWRVSTLASVFSEDAEAMAVFSECAVLDQQRDDALLAKPEVIAVTQPALLEIMINAGGVGTGATYAYRRGCFFFPEQIPLSILSEDKFLPFRAALVGKVFHIKLPLLKYRKTEGSLTDVLERSGRMSWQSEDHWAQLAEAIRSATVRRKLSKLRAGSLLVVMRLRRLGLSFRRQGSKEWAWSRRLAYYFFSSPFIVSRNLIVRRKLVISPQESREWMPGR